MFKISQEYLDSLFPASRTNEFFDALFGDINEGAYDIRLSLNEQSDDKVIIYYELHARPNKCLVCNLTTGLPNVFTRHPIIGSKKTAEILAEKLAWAEHSFEIGATKQVSSDLHVIPLVIKKV